MTFYVEDTTLQPPSEKRFQSYKDFVLYLDGMSQRAYGQTRVERTRLLEEIGHGIDDNNATLFVRSMQDKFSIGIIREERRVRCDIPNVLSFQQEEYGD
jgi:hypothetical protein